MSTGCASGIRGQIFEEIFGVEKGAELRLAVVRRDLPQAFAGQVLRRDVLVEGLVVAAEVLGERVGHDLVHIDTDALHGSAPEDSCQFGSAV